MESVLEFGPGGRIIGILTHTHPAEDRSRVPAIVITNSGIIHRAGANRLHVRLARLLARHGYPTLRYDLPGIGDSEVIPGTADIRQMNLDATRSGFDKLERLGVAQSFIMVGLCSGADHSFAVTAVDSRVVGAVLIDPTAIVATRRHRINQLLGAAARGLRPRTWWRLVRGQYDVRRMVRQRSIEAHRVGVPVSLSNDPADERRGLVAGALQAMIERAVRLQFVITGHNREVYSYPDQIFDAFPELSGLRETVTVALRPSATHTFSDETDRRFLDQLLVRWLQSFGSPSTPRSSTDSSAVAIP